MPGKTAVIFARTLRTRLLARTEGENLVQIVVVFGVRFVKAGWERWEHRCTYREINSLLESALAKAMEREREGNPAYIDYLDGARNMFDASFGTGAKPAEGDILVYGLRVDHILIGEFDFLKRHFASE